jgi:RNA-splicing ligase RtcB
MGIGMNKRIKKLAEQAKKNVPHGLAVDKWIETYNEKFAKLIVEEVLDQVKERAYYTGDRDWSDEVDRPWIQLEFGYGSLADAKKGIFK